jgi:hypothetical protein
MVTPPPAAAIGLSPDIGSANDTITINGTGYPSNANVSVYIGRADEAPFPQPLTTSQSNGQGNVTISLLVPATWPNSSPINRNAFFLYVATENFTESASAKFTYVPAEHALLTLSPAQGETGSLITVTGAGFAAESRVELYLSTPDGKGDEASHGQTTTSQKGNFVIQFTVPMTWADGEPIMGNVLRVTAVGQKDIQATVDLLLLNGNIE